MRTVKEIHEEIESLSEDRTELWHKLSDRHDPEVRAEIHAIDAKLDRLWASATARRSSPARGSRNGSSAQRKALRGRIWLYTEALSGR